MKHDVQGASGTLLSDEVTPAAFVSPTARLDHLYGHCSRSSPLTVFAAISNVLWMSLAEIKDGGNSETAANRRIEAAGRRLTYDNEYPLLYGYL
jgi:hypothetical protein